jgi:prepilin-type N-terminal cleavage/methylation domain-containing protein
MTDSHGLKPSSAGFSLIEIMVALVIVSVAILSLGSFAISIIDNGQQSRERLSAVHLAEQVLEFWQQDTNDYMPAIASDCVLTTGTYVPAPSVSATCTPASGVSIAYTVAASVGQTNGPLPSNLAAFQPFTSAGLTLTPMIKLVTVSWQHKGAAHSVYLTHLTVMQ